MEKTKIHLAGIGVMLTMAAIAQGAPIDVTGGTLSASASTLNQTTTVLTSPDYFQATASYTVSTASMSVNNAGGALALNGRAHGDYYDFNFPISAQSSASINFSLASTTDMLISWTSIYQDGEVYSGGGNPGSLSLYAGTTRLFYCATDRLSCSTNAGTGQPPLSSITLGPGNYSVTASLFATPRSSAVENSFQFALTPISTVPLPMAGWLLLSGLGGLFGVTRGRRRFT